MTPSETIKALCGAHWRASLEQRIISRVWRRDHTLWKPDPSEISNRLGWLDLPASMRGAVGELEDSVEDARMRRVQDVVLCGMGGSSLCAEVLWRVWGARKGFPRLRVLDTTSPDWIARVKRRIRPERTLSLPASKSGGTVESLSLYRHFHDWVSAAKSDRVGENFAAITDEGSPLQDLARENGFLRCFINPSDVGGRYSALSYFGLVPAALMGLDIDKLLSRAAESARACGIQSPLEENPGAWLGMAMGNLALTGRDKLTLITSPRLAAFGLWAEQLVAESTGKEGRGIVPVSGEPVGTVESYGADRLFVYLRLDGDENADADAHVEALHAAGFPIVRCRLRDEYDLAAQFFNWEFGVAAAGACLGIQPFDQPNVAESKAITQRFLAQYETTGALPPLEDEGDFAALLDSAVEGDSLALMSFTDAAPELDAAFDALRRAALERRHLPTTLGYGPRFLHSTGQLHKGGANNGLFVQFTATPAAVADVPGEPYDFAALIAAQALGDFEALRAHGRRVIRIHADSLPALVARVRGLSEAF